MQEKNRVQTDTRVRENADGLNNRPKSSKKNLEKVSQAKTLLRRSRYRQIQEAFRRHMDEFEGDPFPSFLETLLFERIERRSHPR